MGCYVDRLHGYARISSRNKKKLISFSGDLVITKHTGEQKGNFLPVQPRQVSALLENCPSEVDSIQAFTKKTMLLHTKEGIEGIVCRGLSPNQSLKNELLLGSLPHFSPASYQPVLIVSGYLAERLSLHVGDEVCIATVDAKMRYRKLKIIAIYRNYLNELDGHVAFCDVRLLQQLNNWTSERVSGYEIFLKTGVTITRKLYNTILDRIDRELRLLRMDKQYAHFYDWLAIIQYNTLLFISFILLVAGSTMMATAMVQLMERSYMIGVFHSLGAPRWKINSILLFNSWSTLYRGLLYGNLIAIGLCFLQDHYKLIKLEPALYYMNHLPIAWNLSTLLLLNLLAFGSMGLVLLATLQLVSLRTIRDCLTKGA
ncbi:MAG: hypothetical protein K2X94_03505 [Amoebophilaceae bacterium]|nr:hypothetical protein [Amoebophilaceae bacterium]